MLLQCADKYGVGEQVVHPQFASLLPKLILNFILLSRVVHNRIVQYIRLTS